MNDMTPKEYKAWYKTRQPKASNAPAWIGLAVVFCVGLIIAAAVLVDMYPRMDAGKSDSTQLIDTVGKQATHVPRRSDPIATAIPRNGTLSDADYNATSQAQFDNATGAGNQSGNAPAINPTPVIPLGDLPMNGAGNPIINTTQQQQLNASANLALLEREQARITAQAIDVASRAPDVSKADAESMMHRDLCHVPRADPHTCEQGLYKPTPVN